VDYYHEINSWEAYQEHLAFRWEHRDENQDYTYFDPRPNYHQYWRMGRVGAGRWQISPQRINFEKLFEEGIL
jgi:hypothetical protein